MQCRRRRTMFLGSIATIVALLVLPVTAALAQVLLTEDFGYVAGTNLTANGWAAHSAAGINPIHITSGGLAYPGYSGSGVGNAAGPLATSGEDDNRTFAQQTSGTVYAAAMVAVAAAQPAGDYFFHLAQAPVSSIFPGRVFARSSGTGFQIGLAYTTEAPSYAPAVFPLGQAVLVVLKYTFNAGANNDQAALFVNPPLGGGEPAPTLASSNPISTDATSIGAVALRQGSATASASAIVDGIHVGRTWNDVTGATQYILNASAGAGGSISPSGTVMVPGGANINFTITPDAGYHIQDVLVDGVSQGPVPTYMFTAVAANHMIAASFALDGYAINASAGANGTISPSGVVNVSPGADQTFEIVPDPGFVIQDVVVDGASVGPVTSFTFFTVSANHTITVTFAGGSAPALTLEQLDYTDGVSTVQNSDIGRCSFSYAPIATPQFINVVARVTSTPPGAWVVRNLYLPDAASAPPIENLSSHFPLAGLGLAVGQAWITAEYDVRVTNAPLSDSAAGAWLASAAWRPPVTVAHPAVQVGGAVGVDAAVTAPPELLSWFPPFINPLPVDITEWIGCRMPNIDLDDSTHAGDLNGCVPASCANSLLWLESQHPEISFPPDLRAAFDQLSNLMNRMAGQGATEAEMIQAKLDFIEAYGLPIRVDYQSTHLSGPISSSSGKTRANDHGANAGDWPTLDFLTSEASHGEDVELFGGFYYHDANGWHRAGGHAVVVTGLGTIGGKPFVVYKHDRKQSGPGGTVQEGSGIDVVGGAMHVPGLDGWVKVNGVWTPVTFWVEGVIGESYDPTVGPVSSSDNFGDYCNYVIRTIAPGKKLVVTYPHGNRCFNSTVYVLDRTVKPPVWRKVRTWNFNSDSTRVYVNTSTNPVTVRIHNDDHTYSGGAYVPFGVGVASATTGGSTTSSSNAAVYGGFSLGGADGSSAEFGSPPGSSVTVDASDGMSLSDVPARMGPGGVQQLTLTQPVAQWNAYWTHLELHLTVAFVAASGNLSVDVPGAGFHGSQRVDHAGTYELDLGTIPVTAAFAVTLTSDPSLDFQIDAIGVPSLVTPTLAAPLPQTPSLAGLWNLGPNPATRSIGLRFDLPREGRVSLAVFDVTGARVATLASGRLAAGSYSRTWTRSDAAGRAVPAGLYFAKLVTETGAYSTRIIVVR